MELSAVVERLADHLCLGGRIGPGLGAAGEADEIGDGLGGFLVEELAGHAAHGGVEEHRGTGGCRGGWRLDHGGRGVGQGLWNCGGGWHDWSLRRYCRSSALGRGDGHGREADGGEGEREGLASDHDGVFRLPLVAGESQRCEVGGGECRRIQACEVHDQWQSRQSG